MLNIVSNGSMAFYDVNKDGELPGQHFLDCLRALWRKCKGDCDNLLLF